MKDFYKILGVKEDASEEEIRERWVELTKQYHPDRSEESTSAEKIREINQAYQVLKYSSTRVEYDLKRTYGQKDRKRTVHFKKWGVLASILIISIIVGVIYIKNFETNQINQTNQINKMNQTSRKNPTIQSPDEARQPIPASTQTASTYPRVATSTQSVPPSSKSIAFNKKASIDQINQTNQTDQKNQIDQRNRTNKRNRIGSSTQSRAKDVMSPITPSFAMAAPPQSPVAPLPVDVVANQPTPSINQIEQRNQTDQRNQIDQRNQFKPAPLLSTEDEVEKFFSQYVNAYNRRDAKAILFLFSSKAIQNQKEGLEEIRNIYADFFSEGQGIRYSLQEMKIEIYQNAIVVKARYGIEQIAKTTGEKEVWRGPIRWVLIKEDGKLKILTMDYKYHRPSLPKEEGVE